MSRINGRRREMLDHRDRGLQYGDGLFETLRVHRGRIRLLDYHLERLREGCGRLGLEAPEPVALRRELERSAGGGRAEAILKLLVTRGRGTRGYRPTGRERLTRILTRHALPRSALANSSAARVRLCATPLSVNPKLAGLKTLNRLDSVLARSEWHDERIWEGLMSDMDGNWVCGTMSNLFLMLGNTLVTPLLDRCGVAGVMRRWILESAAALQLRVAVRPVRWEDLRSAEEVFMSNAIIGIRSVRSIEGTQHGGTLKFSHAEIAERLRARLQQQ